jgi:hypothetical protein
MCRGEPCASGALEDVDKAKRRRVPPVCLSETAVEALPTVLSSCIGDGGRVHMWRNDHLVPAIHNITWLYCLAASSAAADEGRSSLKKV